MRKPLLSERARRAVRTVVLAVVFLVLVVLLMMWLAGAFGHKVEPGDRQAPALRPLPADAVTAAVEVRRVPVIESAVGSIRAVYEAQVAAKILAKVERVDVTAGQPIQAGDVLVKLADADLKARLQQAEAMLAAAVAARDQAKREFEAVEKLFAQDSATRIELDRKSAAYQGAAANVTGAEQAVSEAKTVLEYATIRSPLTGVIVDKKINAGDTAMPGQVLLTLYDPTRMQLIASVRESLARRLAVGQPIGVYVDALGKECGGTVSEIVPEAESASRTFLVKVIGPCPAGIYAGMFGRLRVPLDEQTLLVIPAAAVQRIGQLDVVDVVDADRVVLQRRTVQLGRSLDDGAVQVLSGLREGELVLIDSGAR